MHEDDLMTTIRITTLGRRGDLAYSLWFYSLGPRMARSKSPTRNVTIRPHFHDLYESRMLSIPTSHLCEMMLLK
jgi:hypothetical protein